MANVTGDNAQQVSSYMTAIWNNYAKGSEDLEHFTDVMADLGARTASSSSEIADGLQQFVSLGPVIGLSFDNAAAALAAVSSSTRESATTIGNSFKTIFARLQGLQMGETLDDGIDLNKYSQALNAIGVNILDQNEELKDADIILEDIMSKWDGLSQKTKVATAQAVAGVHQYSRFMALMEAQDAYHQNLEWAKEADGAVDKQLEYYEESWTAAANRLQDSFNDLYNTMNLDAGAKGILDVFSEIIESLTEATDSLGGFKTLLMGTAAVLTGAFSTQIAGAFTSLRNNITTAFNGKTIAQRNLDEMRGIVDQQKQGMSDGSEKEELEAYERLIALKYENIEASKTASEAQKTWNQQLEDSLMGLIDRQRELNQLLKESEEAQLNQTEDLRFKATTKEHDADEVENLLINYADLTRLNTENRGARETLGQLQSAFARGSNVKSAEEFSRLYTSALEEMNQVFPKTMKELKNSASKRAKNFASGAYTDRVDVINALNTILNGNGKNGSILGSISSNASEKRADIHRNLKKQGLSDSELKKYREETENNERMRQEYERNIRNQKNIPNQAQSGGATDDRLNSILKTAAAAGQAAFALQSVQAVWADITSEDTTGLEKGISALMNLSFIAPSILTNLNPLRQFVTDFRGNLDTNIQNSDQKNKNKKIEDLQKQRQELIDRRNSLSNPFNYSSNKNNQIDYLDNYIANIDAEMAQIERNATSATGKIKGLGTTIKGVATGAQGLGAAFSFWAVAIGLTVTIASKLYSVLIRTTSEAKNNIDEAINGYQTAKGELEDIQSQIDQLQSKIDELKSDGVITFADEAEIAKLEREQAILEAQVAAKEKLVDLQKKEVINTIEDENALGESNLDQVLSKVRTNYRAELQKGTGAFDAGYGGYIQTAKEGSPEYIEAQGKALQEVSSDLDDATTKWQAYIEARTDDNGNLDTSGNFYDELEEMSKTLEEVYGDDNFKINIQPVLDMESVEASKDDLINFVSENGNELSDLSEEDIVKLLYDSGIEGVQALQQATASMGITLQDFFDNIREQIQNERDELLNLDIDAIDKNFEDFISSLSDSQINAIFENIGNSDKIAEILGITDAKAKELGFTSGNSFIKAFINGILGNRVDDVFENVLGSDKTKDIIKKKIQDLGSDDYALSLEVLPEMSEEKVKEFAQMTQEEMEAYLAKVRNEKKGENTFNSIAQEIKAAKDNGNPYSFDAKNVQDYAKQLQRMAKEGKNVDETLKDNYDDAIKLAYSYEKMNQGIETLRSNGEDWIKILQSQNTLSPEFSKTLNELGDTLSLITGVDFNDVVEGGLDLNFLTTAENLKLVKSAADGSTDSIEKLREVCARQIIVQAYGETDFSKIPQGLQDLTNQCISWVSQNRDTLTIGANINDANFKSTLNKMISLSGMAASQIQSFLSSMGIEAEVETGQIQISGSSAAAVPIRKNGEGPHEPMGGFTTSSGGTETITYLKTLRYKPLSGASGAKAVNSPKNSGSGSKSSGSGSEYKPETLDDEFDKYYYYKKSIEDLAKAYDKLSAARDRAYDSKDYAEKTAQMNANIDARLKVYEQYKKELENDVTFDKKYLSGLGAQFDSWGNMTNYKAFMENQKASFQMQLNKAGSSDAAQDIKDRWELLKSKVEAWQERHDDLADLRTTIEELENTKIDNDLNSFQFQLDLDTTKAEVKLARISREISHLDHYKLNIDLLVNAQKDELGEMLNKLAYQKRFLQQLQAEAATEGMSKNLQDAIFQAQQDIDSLITDIESKIDEIGDDISKVFDDLNERVDSTKNRISSLTNTLSSMQDILNLAGQKYTENATYNVVQEAIRNANKNNAKALKEQYAATKDTLEAMIAARDELVAQGADDAVLKQWNDKIRETQETVDSLGAEVASAVQSAISDIIDAASEALENSMKMAEMALFKNKGGDLDLMQNMYDEYEEQAERYLDDTEKAYELSKLLRQVNTSIADKNNITGSKELAKLADEITAAQAEGVKLNQYDVDLLNAKYQLTLAQIALEEAQNSKTTMRLRRDASGNYTYVYTADADAISDAQQSVEDKQKAIYDLQKEHEKEMISSYWNILSQYEELITQLQEKETQGIIDHKEFIDQKKAIDELYNEKIKYTQDELNKVYDNSALKYEDSVLKKTTGLSTLEKATDKSYKFIESISTAATENSETRTDAIKDMLGSLGIKMEDLADKTEGYTNQISVDINNMTTESIDSLETFRTSIQQTINKLKELSAAMSDAYGTTASASLDTGNVTGHTGDLSKKYMQLVALGKYDEADEVLKERAGKMATMTPEALAPLISNERLEKWKKYYLDESSVYHKYVMAMYDAVMNGASAKQFWEEHVNPQSLDTGGYTGEWGTDGKLAVLHQKELVLNSEDTERVLAAVQMVRDMSSTITSSLAGDLVNLIGTLSGLRNISNINSSEKVPQMVTIDASFPNVSVAAEIEEAFNDLANQAAQFASIKRI